MQQDTKTCCAIKSSIEVTFKFLLLLLLNTFPANDLEDYQWKNRLVVFIGEPSENDQLQLKAYQAKKRALEERKIIFIQVSDQGIKELLPSAKELSPSTDSYKKFKKRYPKSSVLLIGLDGGVKRNTKTLFEPSALFGIIDSMPMRASEIRRKNE